MSKHQLQDSERFLDVFEQVVKLADKRARQICRRLDRSIVALVAEGYLQAAFDLGEAQRNTATKKGQEE